MRSPVPRPNRHMVSQEGAPNPTGSARSTQHQRELPSYLRATRSESVAHAHLPAALNVGSIFLALFVSISVGVLFGWFPARRAARLDIIEALRHVGVRPPRDRTAHPPSKQLPPCLRCGQKSSKLTRPNRLANLEELLVFARPKNPLKGATSPSQDSRI